MGRAGTHWLWPCVLITRRSQVQILPPLLRSSRSGALSHWEWASCFRRMKPDVSPDSSRNRLEVEIRWDALGLLSMVETSIVAIAG
jgi:hypothetical protein